MYEELTVVKPVQKRQKAIISMFSIDKLVFLSKTKRTDLKCSYEDCLGTTSD